MLSSLNLTVYDTWAVKTISWLSNLRHNALDNYEKVCRKLFGLRTYGLLANQRILLP